MIAVVVPTIRPEKFEEFKKAWMPLIEKHKAILIPVYDGKKPYVKLEGKKKYTAEMIMGKYADTIFNFNAGVRNLGFAYIAKYLPDVEYIITTDDDVVPIGDTIQDHISTLKRRMPISWLSTASRYMRGFPYGIRQEAEVVISHGVWEGVKDWDSATQLIMGNQDATFYTGPIPRGALYPMSSMNLAFKRIMLPFIYHAPATLGIDRFEDIWAGIVSKREIDKYGWAVATGYARVFHNRASNVFKNLQKEAVGIELNETFWKQELEHPYFKVYNEKLGRWKEWLAQCASR